MKPNYYIIFVVETEHTNTVLMVVGFPFCFAYGTPPFRPIVTFSFKNSYTSPSLCTFAKLCLETLSFLTRPKVFQSFSCLQFLFPYLPSLSILRSFALFLYINMGIFISKSAKRFCRAASSPYWYENRRNTSSLTFSRLTSYGVDGADNEPIGADFDLNIIKSLR